jgi:hypothetical protein
MTHYKTAVQPLAQALDFALLRLQRAGPKAAQLRYRHPNLPVVVLFDDSPGEPVLAG